MRLLLVIGMCILLASSVSAHRHGNVNDYTDVTNQPGNILNPAATTNDDFEQLNGEPVSFVVTDGGYKFYKNDVTGHKYRVKVDPSTSSGAAAASSTSTSSASSASSTLLSTSSSASGSTNAPVVLNPPTTEYYLGRTASGWEVFENPQYTQGLGKIDSWQAENLLSLHQQGYRIQSNADASVTPIGTTINYQFNSVKMSKSNNGDTSVVTYEAASGSNPAKVTRQQQIVSGSQTVTMTTVSEESGVTSQSINGFRNNNGDLPFVSDKWRLTSSKKEGIQLLYDGQEGKINTKENRFDFEEGGHVQKQGDTIIAQDARGRVTLTNTKDNSEFSLGSNDAERFLAPDAKTKTLPAGYLESLPGFFQAAENARVSRSSLKRENDYLITDSRDVKIYEGSSGLALERGSFDDKGVLDTTKDYRRTTFEDERVKETVIKEGTTTSTVEWIEDSNEVRIDGTIYTRETDNNVVVYCPGGSTGAGCINLDDKNVYVKKGDDWQRCDTTACKELEEKAKGHIIRRRIDNGGPTTSELFVRNTFRVLESSQRGFGKLFSLFMDEEDKLKWQREVDNFLCSSIILGGKDCWSSQVCELYSEDIPDNVIAIETPQGFLDVTAFIEGSRQEITAEVDGEIVKQYLYKIRYAVKNQENAEDDLSFNIRISGERSLEIYNQPVGVAPGDTFSERAGNNPLIEPSFDEFDTLCIEFSKPIRISRKESKSTICNDIVAIEDTQQQVGTEPSTDSNRRRERDF